MRTDLDGRSWRKRALVDPAVAAITCATALATVSVSPALAAYDSSGVVTLSGAVSGTLHVPASVNYGGLPGCAIAGLSKIGSTVGATDTMNWNNVKLKVNNKLTTLPFVDLAVDIPDFGKTFTMQQNVSGEHTGVTLTVGSTDYSSTSGSATSAVGGKSGSLHGVLAGATGAKGSVTITAHWAGCVAPNTP